MEATPNSPITYEVEQLAEGVHAYVQPDGGWCLNNAGIVIGTEGTLLIDTAATQARALVLRETVHTLSARPVGTLVNTHSHGDHTFGNHLFAESATIVAHERAAAEMAEYGLALRDLWPQVHWGHVEPTLPKVTYRDRLSLPDLGVRVELLHAGPGHTAGDTVVWLPDQRVLFAGDLVFSGATPFVLMGSLSGSLRVLDQLRRLEPLHVVPGHGPPGGPELLDANADYLRWVDELARTGMAEGLPPLDLARASGPGPYGQLLDSERLVGNLVRAYAELRGAEPAAPLDVPAAFEDIVALHGSLPHCSA
ncbi:MBL fold metallo-hydrolase [Streptomyces coacervatus]|uniref:MBL fold metallo-hydrolase n=1 Tax=Streptomyces coacervatus TaxID=647381 RepID=A0ABP7IW36_9ACTN|nr:MBL fold metallo-hydrolase [Streptomyces coacervatus]MDF2269749.1 MBL fold metallo-hydrolase [Streptomyces coacervatus]